MGRSSRDPKWAPFPFHTDTAGHGAAPWEVGDFRTSAPKCAVLGLPFLPAFVRAAFPTTPSSAGAAEGFAQRCDAGRLYWACQCPLQSAVTWARRKSRNLGTTFPSHFVTLASAWRISSGFGWLQEQALISFIPWWKSKVITLDLSHVREIRIWPLGPPHGCFGPPCCCCVVHGMVFRAGPFESDQESFGFLMLVLVSGNKSIQNTRAFEG